MSTARCLTCESHGTVAVYTLATSDSPRESGRVLCPCCDGTGRVANVDAHEQCCLDDDLVCVAEAAEVAA